MGHFFWKFGAKCGIIHMETVTNPRAEYDELLKENADLQQRIDFSWYRCDWLRTRLFDAY